MKIAVINESAEVYNLGAHKIANWARAQGHEVVRSNRLDLLTLDADKFYLSIIFTWDLPKALQDIQLLQLKNRELEVGGPAATAMPEVLRAVGVEPHLGVDMRFELQPGDDYRAVFTSRGCPRKCEFCLVPKLEGSKIVEYEDFPIPAGENPWVCDNNILSTTWEHQRLVVERLKSVRNLDCNSGFDDRIFSHNPQKYWDLYSQLHLEAWRFAYDKPDQKEHIKTCVDFLHSKGVNYRNIIVFCLVGGVGQTFDESLEKLQYLIDIGASPYPQRYRPLNSLTREYNPPDWNKGDLDMLFQWAGVPFVWRSCTWNEFMRTWREKHGNNRQAATGLFGEGPARAVDSDEGGELEISADLAGQQELAQRRIPGIQ